jgi:hypothetical protein
MRWAASFSWDSTALELMARLREVLGEKHEDDVRESAVVG